MRKLRKYLLTFAIIFCSLFLFINVCGLVYAFVTPKTNIENANSFFLYDSSDNLVFQGSQNKEWVNLDDINPYIINATIAVEDKNFFNHNGFDYLRIIKAIFANIGSGKIVQGASTITQQYAKNLFLNFDKSWKRKWKEMWLTYDLEFHYDKEEILEGYLNTINYGDGVYGIGNASKYYFDKDVKDLTLAEASILAGIPNSPANYSPIDNYKTSKNRQAVVLERMYKNGYISSEQLDNALNEKLVLHGKNESHDLNTLLYYKDAVMSELEDIKEIPKSYLETGGIKIYTTLDMNAQSILEEETLKNLTNDSVQVANVLMNPDDGAIIALIGGRNYNKSQFNRATNSIRQPGSTIKPFLYYKALENGFTASTAFLSEATTFYFGNGSEYIVKNSGNIYANKDISMAAAIAFSDNIYAVKTNIFLGEEKLHSLLIDLGITSNISPTPSLALGAYEMNIIEMASLYSALANQGNKIKPHFIKKVEDLNGVVLYEYTNEQMPILDSSITFILSELLTSTYDSNLINYTYPTCINMLSKATNKYAVKSGSTDTDAWVIGYNKDLVLASWVGYDENKELESQSISANKNAWNDIMENYFKEHETSWYEIPKNVVGVLVDPITGLPVNKNSSNKKILYYIKGTEPSI